MLWCLCETPCSALVMSHRTKGYCLRSSEDTNTLTSLSWLAEDAGHRTSSTSLSLDCVWAKSCSAASAFKPRALAMGSLSPTSLARLLSPKSFWGCPAFSTLILNRLSAYLQSTSTAAGTRLRSRGMCTMLSAEHFLSQVVEKSLCMIQQRLQVSQQYSYFIAELSDPFEKHLVSDPSVGRSVNKIDGDLGRSTSFTNSTKPNRSTATKPPKTRTVPWIIRFGSNH
jgi:hypothetical protein